MWDTDVHGRTLNVWAEPEHWDKTYGEQPIVQLDIRVVHLLNGEPTPSHSVIEEVGSGKECRLRLLPHIRHIVLTLDL